MMRIEDKKYVYLIGIGGIGMSALARYFLSRGKAVGGYDLTETELTRQLTDEGIAIHYEDCVECIDERFFNKEETLIIYTPAIPNQHKELNYFRNNGFLFLKRAKVLGILSQQKHSIAVAGTHGKTSVSTMAAFLLQESGVGCNALLGGIGKNYGSNCLLNADSDRLVVEADEYDRSFLNLFPNTLLITAIDPDHLEVYFNRENILAAFNELAGQLAQQGHLLLNHRIAHEVAAQHGQVFTYSLNNPDSDFYASAIRVEEGRCVFTLHAQGEVYENFALHLPGRINIENAVAALSLALLEGAAVASLREVLPRFSGVRRRFDYQLNLPGLVYMDDYAHHPAEIEALHNSLRDFYPGRDILAVFQPHLYTRTRDFATDFAKVLDCFDEIWLMDIYPAREEPLPGVDAGIILQDMKNTRKALYSPEQLLNALQVRKNDIVVTIGAGNIDKQVGAIKQVLTTQITRQTNTL